MGPPASDYKCGPHPNRWAPTQYREFVTYPQYDYGQQPQDPTQYGQPPQQAGYGYGAQPGYPQQPGYQQPGYEPMGQPGYPPQGDPYAYPPGQQPSQFGVTPQERSDAAMGCYLGALFGWIPPLIYRLNAGARSRFVRECSTNALNFHLSVLIYMLGSYLLVCLISVVLGLMTGGIGFISYLLILPVALGLTAWQITAACIGGSKANRGEIHAYPGAIRMIKN